MLTQFVIGCSRTLNLGHYESLRIEATVTITVGEEQDLEALKADAQEELRRLLEETYLAQHKNRASKHGEKYG